MTKPSNFLQKPSPIIVQRQENKKMMCLDEQLQRQLSNISNEDYHGNKFASIPFVWESQPGTPKHRSNQNSLPPLTPPPSYFQNANKKPITKAKKNFFLQSLFHKRTTKKDCVLDRSPAASSTFVSYSSSSSSSSLSVSSPRPTSYSVPSSPMIHSRKGENEDLYDVTSSSVCFGNVRSRGSYSSMFKKVLLGDFM
ncbi:hypothetical protein MtrunA17_Chr5g0432461 [Medicago truncatula]|uniref:Uncharacterized protein n=1 Tax=Medicago truncatula TaxID=3880 RepID=G7KFM9_MEDTR|nr:uncharacterized protein LOC11442068 [Medicago truncatula]AES98960.1 hypothetical protein MTR_5g075040 [Medicago truncatula]RHN56720.1 hypothetical protein MtrunA17_Chr5g0432461 [Medicago truncatula]